MDSINAVEGCAAVLVAILAASRWRPASAPPPRSDALLGFRGLLAIGVFLHHGLIWYQFTHGHGWRDRTAFRQFGESRIALFFMLASLIFYGQLLDTKQGRYSWLRFFVARLFRLAPAYWLAMAIMFALLAFATLHGVDGAGTGIVQRTWPDIFGAAAVWLGFSLLGTPAIDAYMNTPMIVAGVTWTLPYEFAFYFVLPLLALPLRIAVPLGALVVGLCGAFWIYGWSPPVMMGAPFLGGMAAALLIRVPRVSERLRGHAAAVFALIALTCATFLFPTVYAPLPLTLLALSLSVVAAGNPLFGLLTLPIACRLGTMSYSIYLLHGIVLYTLFMLALGVDRLGSLGPMPFALLIAAVTPLVLAASYASQRWIESPAMRAVPRAVAALRQFGVGARRFRNAPDTRLSVDA